MLTTNTIRYGTDNFVFRKQTLLTTSKPWDTTGKTDIEGFELAGIQPADSNRRVIFSVDGKYYKFDSSQNLVEFTNTVDFDNVLADYTGTFGKLVKKLKGFSRELPEPNDWNFANWGITEEEFVNFHRLFVKNSWTNQMAVKPGALEKLTEWRKQGHKLKIVTHRDLS